MDLLVSPPAPATHRVAVYDSKDSNRIFHAVVTSSAVSCLTPSWSERLSLSTASGVEAKVLERSGADSIIIVTGIAPDLLSHVFRDSLTLIHGLRLDVAEVARFGEEYMYQLTKFVAQTGAIEPCKAFLYDLGLSFSEVFYHDQQTMKWLHWTYLISPGPYNRPMFRPVAMQMVTKRLYRQASVKSDGTLIDRAGDTLGNYFDSETAAQLAGNYPSQSTSRDVMLFLTVWS